SRTTAGSGARTRRRRTERLGSAEARPRGSVAAVVPFTGPRCEDEQQSGAAIARDGPPLVGVEVEERSRVAVDPLVADPDADVHVDDEQEGRLLDPVVTERLTGLQLDEHGPLGALLRMQDRGRPRTVRRLDVGKPPVAHERSFPAPA